MKIIFIKKNSNEWIYPRISLDENNITTETEMKIQIKATTGSNYLLSTNLVVPNLFSIDDYRTLSFFHSQSWWEKVKMKKRYTQKKVHLEKFENYRMNQTKWRKKNGCDWPSKTIMVVVDDDQNRIAILFWFDGQNI